MSITQRNADLAAIVKAIATKLRKRETKTKRKKEQKRERKR